MRIRVGGVDDVEEQIRAGGLLQGRAEGFDELVGQVADESDGVGVGEDDAVGGLGLTDGRVEGGEQGVLHHHLGVGEQVEQGGLARVGVPDDRDGGHVVAGAVLPLGLTGGRHGVDLAAQFGHAGTDAATVEFDLRLTGSAGADSGTACDAAAGLSGQRLAPTAQTWQEVFELGEFDLGLAFAGFRVLGEDVEDERDAVDDLDLDDVLESAPLAGGEFGVDDHGVGADAGDDVGEFGGFALAEVGAWVRLVAALDERVEDFGTGGFGECGEFADRVLGFGLGAVPDAGEDDAFEADLAVFDLGDVFELGGESGDTGERGALGEVELVVLGGGFVIIEGLGASGEHTVEHRVATLFVFRRHSFLCSLPSVTIRTDNGVHQFSHSRLD